MTEYAAFQRKGKQKPHLSHTIPIPSQLSASHQASQFQSKNPLLCENHAKRSLFKLRSKITTKTNKKSFLKNLEYYNILQKKNKKQKTNEL